MKIDYPNNRIIGVTILCNIHFENDCFLKNTVIKKESLYVTVCNFIKNAFKDLYSFNIKNENKEIEHYLICFIYQLAESLNLIPLEETLVTKHFKESKPVGEGTTGTMILKTSHICYHTWNKERYMRLELSVCKEVNEYEVVAFIRKYFGTDINFISHQVREW